MTNKTKVLFVCLGNICRSPTAQGVFEKMAFDAELDHLFETDSAGTAAYHIGEKPDPRSIKHAERRFYKLDHQRSRKIDFADFMHFDYILAMDRNNYDTLKELAPREYHSKIHMMLEYADVNFLADINRGSDEVPDPYYEKEAGFEKVLDLLENACDGFLQRFETGE
jgi:protein-tyrosine phosphatase